MAFVTVNIPLQKSALVFENSPNFNYHDRAAYTTYLNPPAGQANKTLLKFGPVPEAYRYLAVYSAKIQAYYYGNKSGNRTIVRPFLLRAHWKDFDASAITWNTTPAFTQWDGVGMGYTFPNDTTSAQISTPSSYFASDDQAAIAKRLATEVVFLFPYLPSAGTSDSISLENSSARPITLAIQFFDSITVKSKIVAADKTSGYVNPAVANTFSWTFEENDAYNHAIGPWEQQTATFFWRVAGASTWNSIAAGTVSQVTIPANTFPLGDIEWYVAGTDTQGTASQTDVFTVYTGAAASYASPISPADTLINSDVPITFTWSVANANNPVQTGADIQYSADDGSSWTQLGHAEGDVREFTIGAGAMPGGSIQWRVRSYNADGVAGPWSDPASFYYIAAPAAPIVTATEVPFTTVTWTASGQQAYEVLVDGVSSGIRFGTGKQFIVKEPLIDGGHTIQVRVQGIYGLWSTPGETSITVQNDPGESIALTAVSDLDTLLTWETDSTVQLTRIYRDGKQIGIAAGFSFRDRVSLGEHSFYVLQELPDGNYTQSNIVVSTSAADMAYIAPASGGEWLPLKLSENSASAQYFTFNRSHSLRHVTGAVFPVVEVAQFQDLSGSYDVAFADLESAKGFESLFGKIVIVKSRGNSVLIGPLVALNKTHNDFYINYTFTIQQIDWEDFVNAEDSGL